MITRNHHLLITGAVLLLIALMAMWSPMTVNARSRGPQPWLDPDGQVLPFGSDEDVLAFLSSAEVLSITPIPVGITHPRKILLEKDGIRMHAIFRDVDVYKARRKTPRRLELDFRDYCLFEVAAYRMGKLLGFDNIPPAVERTIGGKRGSLQAWVERAMTETKRAQRDLVPPVPRSWAMQYQIMWLFDNLIANDDRNQGNILIDSHWGVWMIDATRAFRPARELKNPSIIRFCEREIWQRLQTVPDETIKASLRPYLSGTAVRSLLERRRILVEHIRTLIQSRGEDLVLFDFDDLGLEDQTLLADNG